MAASIVKSFAILKDETASGYVSRFFSAFGFTVYVVTYLW